MIPEDWEVHTLGDEVDQLEAGVSVNSVDEEFHVYAHEQAILKTSSGSSGYFLPHENKKIAPGDIKRAKLNPRIDSIIISRMNTPDLVGECGYVEKDYHNLFLPDRLWMTRFKRESKINVKWLSYLLSFKEYKVKIKVAATGTSGSMKNISKTSLLSITIPFPSPKEQTGELPLIQRDKVRNVPFLEDGDLVMADASEDYEGIGISIEVKNATGKKVVAGLHTFLLRGDKEVLADGFKGYLQYIPAVKDSLKKAATGISVYGISKNNVRNISIYLPDITEQRAIVAILSDIDAEIAALEQKRDKIRALKQGMMQELLTGKTRLL